MKVRQLTREDWNDISKLRFRDGKGEIIDVKIFDIGVEKYNYPVAILYKKGDSYLSGLRSIEGYMLADSIRECDIVIEEPEEVNYEEIVKELMVNNAFLSEHGKMWYGVKYIDPPFGFFATLNDEKYKLNLIKNFYISFDLKTFYTFNEYLELRRKQ